MQLQGELTKSYQKTYTSTSKSAVLIVKSDGVKALWSGLSAGLIYQVVMNGSRLTLFDNLSALGVPALPAGMISGAVGGGVGSPFYLLKTQQQALSNLNVGSQHTGKKILESAARFSFRGERANAPVVPTRSTRRWHCKTVERISSANGKSYCW